MNLRLVLREVGLVLGAVTAAVMVARTLPRVPRPTDFPADAPAPGMMIANPATVPPEFARETLARRLRDGDAVLLGSSELAFGGETAPQKFFPRACGRPILTVGRAGFQSLPMLITLAEVRDALSSQSDVTVILSPGWFAEFGTSSGAFLTYLKHDGLRALFARDDLPTEVRDAVAREIRVHRDEFSGLYPDWILPWWPQLTRLVPAARFDPHQAASVHVPAVPKFDWDASEREWRARTVTAAEGNPLGTLKSYYVKNQAKLPKKVTPLDLWDVERRDLYALSQLMRDRGTHARFVIQPLHRRVYRDLSAYDRSLREAVEHLTADGHRVIDLGVEPYDLQLLEDSVHYSGYGWVKVQREMCQR